MSEKKNFCENIKKIRISLLIRLLWYLILTYKTYSYCYKHWKDVIIMTPFSGNSMMFILLIILLLMPLVTELQLGDNRGVIKDPFEIFKESEANYKNQVKKYSNANMETSMQDKLLKEVENLEKNKGVANV